MNVKLEDIKKKNPFIYSIEDDYFIIGCGIFKRCKSQVALLHYQQYRNEIDRLGKDFVENFYSDCPASFDALVNSFIKVMKYAEDGFPNEDVAMTQSVDEFLDTLNVTQKNILLQQLEKYVISFSYYYKRIK